LRNDVWHIVVLKSRTADFFQSMRNANVRQAC
jgi:hypothetical protein